MDQRPKYERTIAARLQALPIPDLQDAIWARVEAQLDIDLPTDDGGGDNGGSPNTPSGPGFLGWGLSVLVVSLVTTFFLLKNNQSATPRSEPPSVTQSQQSSSQPAESPPLPGKMSGEPKIGPINRGDLPFVAKPADSSNRTDMGLAPAADSASGNTSAPTVTLMLPPPSRDTLSPAKKGKGMKGLTDADYRIVPKKGKGE